MRPRPRWNDLAFLEPITSAKSSVFVGWLRFSRVNRVERCLPRSQVNEMPAAFIQLLIQNQFVGLRKIVLPKVGGVSCPLKPRSDKGCGREIPFVGNRFWDEGL